MFSRLACAPAAAAVLDRLVAQHGPVLLHLSGGCCDGSAPMCYPQHEFRVGSQDCLLGEVAGVPVYVSAFLSDYWAGSHLTLSVEKGRSSGFSLEGSEGVRFVMTSRLLTDTEAAALACAAAPAVPILPANPHPAG